MIFSEKTERSPQRKLVAWRMTLLPPSRGRTSSATGSVQMNTLLSVRQAMAAMFCYCTHKTLFASAPTSTHSILLPLFWNSCAALRSRLFCAVSLWCPSICIDDKRSLKLFENRLFFFAKIESSNKFLDDRVCSLKIGAFMFLVGHVRREARQDPNKKFPARTKRIGNEQKGKPLTILDAVR